MKLKILIIMIRRRRRRTRWNDGCLVKRGREGDNLSLAASIIHCCTPSLHTTQHTTSIVAYITILFVVHRRLILFPWQLSTILLCLNLVDYYSMAMATPYVNCQSTMNKRTIATADLNTVVKEKDETVKKEVFASYRIIDTTT
jgi:hypothetical protein